MAIWTNIYGSNGLLNSQQLLDTDYLDILNKIPLDGVKILESIIEFKRDRQDLPDHQLKEHDEYINKLKSAHENLQSGAKHEWKKRGENYFVNNLLYFHESDGLTFAAENGIIYLGGPMFIFGSPGCFPKSLTATSRDYYHNYFKTVLKAFKSDFILYAPEWYGINDGDTETKNLADLLALEDWRKVSSKTIESMEYTYFEEFPTK
jgi:hypothetical protein